jgi:hypothetical protein
MPINSSGEIDITNPMPEVGTPAFGERAKKRREAIAAPAPEDRPTPEELNAAKPAGTEEAWTAPDPASGTAAPNAQGDLSESFLSQFDVPVPTITELVDNPTPPNPTDPEGDIIHRLMTSLLNDPSGIPQPRPFTQGEHIALGILGGMDGEVFQHVVLPMLQAERNAPRQAALDLEAQKAKRITALQTLAGLMETRRQNKAEITEKGNAQLIDLEKMRQSVLAGNANRRAMLAAAMQKQAAKKVAAAKIPDRIMGTYTLAVIAHQDAVAMKKLLDNNIGPLGDEPGGPLAGLLGGVGPGGDVRAKLSAFAGTVNEAIMMITQRRGLNAETQRKIGGSLPDIKQPSATLRRAVETAIRTTGQYISGTEVQYPTTAGMKAQMLALIDKSKGDPDAITAIVQDPESWLHSNGLGTATAPGAENGDTDLNLWLDDSEVK